MSPPDEPRNPLRRIVLTGFMGSGKTTVGRLLATRLAWGFADLDDVVEARLGLTVPQIFAERGEAVFRAAEVDALRELLRGSALVIALGGGAPETPALRTLLAQTDQTAVVYLEGGFEALYERCAAQALDAHATERPLLGPPEAARARLTRRRGMYAFVASHTVTVERASPEAVVDAVLQTVQQGLQKA